MTVATAPRARTGPVLAVVLVSYLMIVLDISIVITALPQLHCSLGFSAAGLSWVQNAYTLVFGGLLLLGARGGDILGRRRTFVAGLALFTASSFAIGLAPSAGWLLAARGVQGVGAAILAPSTLALLTTSFPAGRARTRAIGYYGAVAGVGASLGLVVGGVLTDWISWRAGFFLNVPIGIVLIIAGLRFLPETESRPGRLDLLGALTSTLGMTRLPRDTSVDEEHLHVVHDHGDHDDEPVLRHDQHYAALRLALLARKREAVLELRDEQRIDDIVLRQFQSRLDIEEVRLSRRDVVE